ncbi:hypothetical protein ACPCH0_25740 [Bacillus bombysepticus]|uniref:hypothetical protein n=1 Tax=Bacillus thuringiensis TaxID=1428 RepID=UPI001874CCB4|nr:hypothetical protein [Bacillus thuringiensis]MBE5091308.1 hypothetical protein [Bacillus thuringiensis]
MIICYEVSLFYSAHPDGPIQSLRALQALNPIKEGVQRIVMNNLQNHMEVCSQRE